MLRIPEDRLRDNRIARNRLGLNHKAHEIARDAAEEKEKLEAAKNKYHREHSEIEKRPVIIIHMY